jgi:hypothetical protein
MPDETPEEVYTEIIVIPDDAYGSNGPGKAIQLDERRDELHRRIFRGNVFSGVTKGLGRVERPYSTNVNYVSRTPVPSSGLPVPPVGLTLVNESGILKLTWSYVADDYNGIRIERSFNGGDFVEICLEFTQPQVLVSDPPRPSIYVERPPRHGNYAYRIRCFMNSDIGDPSDVVRIHYEG